MTVYLGAQDVTAIREANRVVVNSKQMFVHPHWKPDTLEADVALIALPIDITFNS